LPIDGGAAKLKRKQESMPMDLAQFRALAAAGRFPPLHRLARINIEYDYDYVQHGLPEVLQRPLWRLLAGRMPR